VESDYPKLDALYKDIHAHPEIAFQEEKTAAKLAAEMRVSAVVDRRGEARGRQCDRDRSGAQHRTAAGVGLLCELISCASHSPGLPARSQRARIRRVPIAEKRLMAVPADF
jgi:hypothetical protein